MRKIRTLALLLGLLCLLTAPVRAEEGAPPEENGELPGAEEPLPADPAPPEPPPVEPAPQEPVPEEPAPADPIVLPVPPVVRTEPRDLSCAVGERVVLRTEAEAYDGGTLGFQWYMGRTADKAAMHPVNGNGAELIPDTSAAGTTYYYVSVSSTLNGQTASADSRIASVTVAGTAPPEELKPVIRVQPKGADLDYGGEWTLSVQAECPGAELGYQWYVSDTPDKASPAALGTRAEQRADTGHAGARYYFVRVFCSDGSRSGEIESGVACVTVGAEKPRIIRAPESVTVRQGEPCSLSVEAELSGGGTLSYVWYQSTRPDQNTMTAMNRGQDMGDTLKLDSSVPSVRYYYVQVRCTENGEMSRVSGEIVTVQILGEESPDTTAAPDPAPTVPPTTPSAAPLPASVTLEEEAGELKGAFPVRLGAAALLGAGLGVLLGKLLEKVFLSRKKREEKD